MKSKFLTALLGIAVLAVPAAVPASQHAVVRAGDLVSTVVALAPENVRFATLITDPHQNGELSIELAAGHTTLGWIDTDPFL